MNAYTAKKEISSAKAIVCDDMLLTTDMPTTAGSKMLDGYMSLLEAEAITRLKAAGYELSGKADVGEFAIDLLGETSSRGALARDGIIKNASAEIVKSGDAIAAICLDVNGSVRRAAAQSGLVSLKATYGTVSRYGTVPVACSGETVSILANGTDTCREILDVIAGHDDKDGTSLPDDLCSKLKSGAEYAPIRRVAVVSSFTGNIDDGVKAKLDAATYENIDTVISELKTEINSATCVSSLIRKVEPAEDAAVCSLGYAYEQWGISMKIYDPEAAE